MKRLEGRVAIVTGAGMGLGSGIALRLAEEGAKVACVDLKPEAAEDTVAKIKESGGEAAAFKCDVSNGSEVEAMVKAVVEKYGKVDELVNNVGVSTEARNKWRITDLTEEAWDFLLNVNLKSVFLTTKYTVPEMIKNGGGSIVNISSLAGLLPNFGAGYGAAKAGQIAFTKSTAVQYADYGIRCNVICPGAMDTPGGVSASGKGIFKNHNQHRSRMINDRAGLPEDIAAAVAFLLSDDASFITATTLSIDGGALTLLTEIPKIEEE